MKIRVILLIVAASLVGGLQNLHAADYDPNDTARVSAGTYDSAPETNGASTNARMSKNGRFIVFESVASNIVTTHAVTPGRKHCYIYDRQADQIELISLTSSGNEIESDCNTPAVSNDGRYVTFASIARVGKTVSLGSGIFNHVHQAYDSPADLGISPSTSGSHIWVRDRYANDTMLVSQVSLPVKRQAIDPATLQPQIATDDATGFKVPVLETVTRRIAAVQLTSTPSNSFNPRISADGQFIVYDTDANNLVLVSSAQPEYPTLTRGVDYDAATGIVFGHSTVFFLPSSYYLDGNGVRDVYVRDGNAFTNSLVSLSCKFHEPSGCSVQGTNDASDAGISDDGATVVFSSATKFLDLDFNGASDIFLVERTGVNGEVSSLVRVSNNTSRIVAGNGASTKPALSADGRFVAFQSAASNLVSGDTNGRTDIFLFDRKFNRMILCSNPSSGTANQNSTRPDVSGAGEYVVFHSTSSSFGVSSGVDNVYMGTVNKGTAGDAQSCSIALISKGSGSGAASTASIANVGIVPRSATINGELVRTRAAAISYQTSATNICSESDTNGVTDIFQTPICTDAERTTDTDSDGTSDCFDQCASDPIKVESIDTDADGVADCEDGCPTDPQKIGAGLCGCGATDTDSDGDSSADCVDACPNDPNKTVAGSCGCGIPDTDADGNGTADCNDSTAPSPGTTPGATPTATATATPTFNLSGYTPQAPRVRRAGKLTVDIQFSLDNISTPGIVTSFRLTGRKLTSSRKKIRQRVGIRRNRFLGGKLKLPSSGRWRFTVSYNGISGDRSLESVESRAIVVK